jgi:hypothetical protein
VLLAGDRQCSGTARLGVTQGGVGDRGFGRPHRAPLPAAGPQGSGEHPQCGTARRRVGGESARQGVGQSRGLPTAKPLPLRTRVSIIVVLRACGRGALERVRKS